MSDERGQLREWREHMRVLQAKVVATNGCFDILHAGHVQMLENAQRQGDVLVVGINSDKAVRELKGANRPINSETNRAKMLSALRCVDFVYIFDDTCAAEFISIAEPDIYVKAADYSVESMKESEKFVLNLVHAKIVISPFVDGLSTTSLIERLKTF